MSKKTVSFFPQGFLEHRVYERMRSEQQKTAQKAERNIRSLLGGLTCTRRRREWRLFFFFCKEKEEVSEQRARKEALLTVAMGNGKRASDGKFFFGNAVEMLEKAL